MLSLFSVSSALASISATICTVCRPMLTPDIDKGKLPFVVPLLFTVCESHWCPSRYSVTVLSTLPLTAKGMLTVSLTP